MKYKYYLGPSGSGKTKRIMEEMLKAGEANKDKNYILVVPDQYTMQAQKDMVAMSQRGGILNIDVQSFGRLAHRIFEEVGASEAIILDDTGKNLLLRRISLRIEDELESFGTKLKMPGFIHEVKSVISELMQYGVGPDKLEELISYAVSNNKKALASRLRDIKRLYVAFLEEKQDRFQTTEEQMIILAGLIPRSRILEGAVVAFDGFTGFTPVQNSVLSALLQKTDEMWFSFSIDKEALDSEEQEGELFGLSKKAIKSLNRRFLEENAVHLEDVYMETRGVRYKSSEIAAMERNIFRKNNKEIIEENKDIHIQKARDPRLELKACSVEIKRLIREEGYAYRDIAIVTGALEEYAAYADEIFSLYELPVFVDRTRHLELNPFTELIKGALKIIESNFSYENVIHFLRTYLTDVTRDEIDELDNYIVARGIRGLSSYNKSFIRKAHYMLGRENGEEVDTEETLETLKRLNTTREKFMSILEPLLPLAKGENSVADMTKALYEFITKNDTYRRIKEKADLFEVNGDMTRKKEYDQIYQSIMELLEQLHNLLGQDILTLSEYIRLLEAGISEIKIGVLPAEVDYIVMGDIERTRLKEIKALFFLGVNDGIIPKSGGNGGILSDLDREFFSNFDIELSPTPRQKMFNQRLYLYMNMTKPSERLYISYALNDNQGKAIRPAYLIDLIKKLYKETKENIYNEDKILDNIAGKKDADSYLATLIRRYALDSLEDGKDKALFFSLYDEAVNEKPEYVENLNESAFYEYNQANLEKEIVHALYGETLINSVSKLEKYASCAYEHFLSYGLKLNVREEYSVERFDLGNIYHTILEGFSNYLKDNNLDWGNLEKTKAELILNELFDNVTKSYNEGILYQDKRNIYQLEKMRRILLRTIKSLGFQIKRTSFKPTNFEMRFTRALTDKDFRVGLSDEDRMRINGRIDRVDTYEDQDKLYVKVVDYKSGNNKLDLVEVYNGLSLQLVVYLREAVNQLAKDNKNKKVIPAAMYYYHVKDPFMETDSINTEDEVNKWIQSNLRLTGLSIDDKDMIEHIGGEFVDKKSEVINATLKINGDYSSNSEVINSDDLKTVMDYAEYKLIDLGKKIIEGNIEARPCQDNTCTYCDYREICGYDSKLDGYKDVSFENAQKKEVLEKMKNILDKGEEE